MTGQKPIPDLVREVLVDQLDVTPERVTDDARVVANLGADSLDSVEIAINLGERLGIDIPDMGAAFATATVADIVRHVEGAIPPKDASARADTPAPKPPSPLVVLSAYMDVQLAGMNAVLAYHQELFGRPVYVHALPPLEEVRERIKARGDLARAVDSIRVVGAEPICDVLADVIAERSRQDAQWGGPEHDDTHTLETWLDLISDQYRLARFPATPSAFTPEARRSRLIKIAALAVAAIESLDRKAAR